MVGLGKALLATLAIGVAVQLPHLALAQTAVPVGDDTVTEIVTWGLREGPAAVVVLVILFFYRRDFLREVREKGQHFEIVTGLVEKTTQSNADMASALRESNTVMHGLKRAIEIRFDLQLKKELDV